MFPPSQIIGGEGWGGGAPLSSYAYDREEIETKPTPVRSPGLTNAILQSIVKEKKKKERTLKNGEEERDNINEWTGVDFACKIIFYLIQQHYQVFGALQMTRLAE